MSDTAYRVKLDEAKLFTANIGVLVGPVEFRLYDDEGTLLDTIDVNPLAVPAAIGVLYQTDEAYTFDEVGTYYGHWYDDDTAVVVSTDEIVVEATPQAELQPEIPGYIALGSEPADAINFLYILDQDGAVVTECVVPPTRAEVTGTAPVVFPIAVPVAFTVAFDGGAAQAVNIAAGVHANLFEVVESINLSIIDGRAVNAGGAIKFYSDSSSEGSQIVLVGADLATLFLTAGTYTPAVLDSPAAVSDDEGFFQTTYPIKLAEGNYLLFWYSSSVGAVGPLEDIWVYEPYDQPIATFVVVDDDADTSPFVGVTASVVKSTGEFVTQEITDITGAFSVPLAPGDYVVTLRRGTEVFTYNNFRVGVEDEGSSLFTNSYTLVTGVVVPQFDVEEYVTDEQLTTMSARFVDLRGQPIQSVTLCISNNFTPFTVTGSSGDTLGVMGRNILATSDARGFLEVELLREVEIVVAIEGTSIRRTFTTPDAATFDLFATLDLDTDDTFGILRIATVDANRSDLP